jgi:uncharacterized protein (DUF305 family)
VTASDLHDDVSHDHNAPGPQHDPPGPGIHGPDTGDEPSGGGWSFGRIAAVVLATALIAFGFGYLAGQPGSPGVNSVDLGFLQDMIDHHDQAVQMAESVVTKPDIDPVIRSFAQEVVRYQRWETGEMDAWLEGWGRSRGDPERRVMGWMGPSLAHGQMPGRQSDAQIEALQAATGRDANALFLHMMTDHHKGGIHMAEYAAAHASSAKVRDLASLMVKNQGSEVREYQATAQRLGVG